MANPLLAEAREHIGDPGVRERCLRDPAVWCAMLDAVVDRMLHYLEERDAAERAKQFAAEGDLGLLGWLCDAAAPGPWIAVPLGEDRKSCNVHNAKNGAIAHCGWREGLFIAAAREAVPKLIVEVLRLTEERDRFEAQAKQYHAMYDALVVRGHGTAEGEHG